MSINSLKKPWFIIPSQPIIIILRGGGWVVFQHSVDKTVSKNLAGRSKPTYIVGMYIYSIHLRVACYTQSVDSSLQNVPWERDNDTLKNCTLESKL